MLMQTIRKDMMLAKKDKNSVKSDLLSTLIGEAAMIGKNAGNRESTDEEVMQVIRKFVKNIDEMMPLLKNEGKPVEKEELEKKILESYLPQQMTEAELSQAIEEIVAALPEKNMKAMGQVMAKLKELYNGRYDGKTANTIVKTKLS